jgi:hypothetical protein
VERDKTKKIGIGWTNVAAVAMETKKGQTCWVEIGIDVSE